MDETIETLLVALREYDYTKKAHDEEMAKCEYSWGYHGHRCIESLHKAEKSFGEALTNVIDARIEAKLQHYMMIKEPA